MRLLRWILLVVALYLVVGAAVVLTLSNTGTSGPDTVEPKMIVKKQK